MKKTILYIVIVLIIIIGAIWIFKPKGTAPSGTTASSTAPTTTGVQYTNSQYGFTFTLPADWQGYTVVTSHWQGTPVNTTNNSATTELGPEILLRNPNWTAANPYQDIPIMIFTPSQWSEIQAEQLAVSAAPIPPSELGSNANYVFALPPRYDYAYPTGYQEVEQIMRGTPLQAF